MGSEVEELLRGLGSEDRKARLAALFALGEAFAGRGAAAESDAQVGRVVAAIESILADRALGTSWVRKRAKRALAKIRGTATDDEGGEVKE